MKKLSIIFSVLFATFFLNSCTSDDFESQIENSNKTFNNEVDYSQFAKAGDTVVKPATQNDYETGTTESDPIIVIKKD